MKRTVDREIASASLDSALRGVGGAIRRRMPVCSHLVCVVLAAAVAAGSAAAAAVRLHAAPASPRPPAPAPLLVFTGHGWGHGVGMSQYGAYGYAQHGVDLQQILAHYYPGTTVGKAPTRRVRVLLADKEKALKLSSDGAVHASATGRHDAHARGRGR